MPDNQPITWWERLTKSFGGLRDVFVSPLRRLFGSSDPLTPEKRAQLKRLLIEADFGPSLTQELLSLASDISASEPEKVLLKLKAHLLSLLPPEGKPWSDDLRCVILAGVNGAGKTTTIAKIAHLFAHRHPLLIPADTYRAAAIEQLESWSTRYQIPFFAHQLSDPSAVAYQGLDQALIAGQLALIDTSGRLPNNQNLMHELGKIQRVVLKKLEGEQQLRTILVLDASQGQNLLEQVRLFKEAFTVDALIITKLDGSSKAGTLFQISQKYQIPIDYCGVGESVSDLISFEPAAFVEALWGTE